MSEGKRFIPGKVFGLRGVLKGADGNPIVRYLLVQSESGRDDLVRVGLAAALESLAPHVVTNGEGRKEMAVQELNPAECQLAPGFLPCHWVLDVEMKDGDRRRVGFRSGHLNLDLVEVAATAIVKHLGDKVQFRSLSLVGEATEGETRIWSPS